MTTYGWPGDIIPARMQLRLVPKVVTFTAPYSGQMQTNDLMGEYWRMTVDLPQGNDPVLGGRLEALFDRLKGPANPITLWNFRRPVPLGTARGTFALAANAAQLANSIAVGGCVGKNLLLSGGFEIDTNADGVSDGLTVYNSGTSTGRAYQQTAGNGSPTAQRAAAATLGSTSADQVGWSWTNLLQITGGSTYTMAADLFGSTGTTLVIEIDWYNNALVFQGSSVASWAGNSVSYTRRALTAAAPAGATQARVYIYMSTNSAGSPEIRADNVQIEAGGVATAYSAGATLLEGDMLGLGGQLLRVMAAATANDAGVITAEIAPRLRAARTIGAGVTWYYPTGTFLLASDGAPVLWEPGRFAGPQAEFREQI